MVPLNGMTELCMTLTLQTRQSIWKFVPDVASHSIAAFFIK